MSASELVTTIAGGGLGIIILVMSFIQIAPIKINPWSYVLKKIGTIMNEDMSKKVDSLAKDLTDLRTTCDERAMNDCRVRILRFNDEIIHGTRHSKEHFDQILIDISDYETYCKKHKDFRNNIANLAIKHIEDVYNECTNKNTFL